MWFLEERDQSKDRWILMKYCLKPFQESVLIETLAKFSQENFVGRK